MQRAADTVLGPQAFRAEDSPNYTSGFIGLVCCVAVAIIAILSYGFLCRLENRKRDRGAGEAGEGEDVSAAEAFNDLTDHEKPSFRYAY